MIAARKAMAHDGSDDGQFAWTYATGLGARERLDIRHVGRNKGRYVELKRGLKVTSATLGTLALAAGLVDSPISAIVCETLRTELITFQRRLRQQVQIVRALSRDARPSAENSLSWSKVLLK